MSNLVIYDSADPTKEVFNLQNFSNLVVTETKQYSFAFGGKWTTTIKDFPSGAKGWVFPATNQFNNPVSYVMETTAAKITYVVSGSTVSFEALGSGTITFLLGYYVL